MSNSSKVSIAPDGYYHMPYTGFMRLSDVLKVFPVGKDSWWNGIKDGKYPKSVKLSERITAWRAEDIRALIESYDSQLDDATAVTTLPSNKAMSNDSD